jgi:hypothetical protein
MISFHHSFSTRIFLNETSSPERDARRAAASRTAAAAQGREEAGAPNEMREFWWFLRSAKNPSGKPSSREAAKQSQGLAGARPSTSQLQRGKHA